MEPFPSPISWSRERKRGFQREREGENRERGENKKKQCETVKSALVKRVSSVKWKAVDTVWEKGKW